jgi:Ca2+-binding RTX toxin-like protein
VCALLAAGPVASSGAATVTRAACVFCETAIFDAAPGETNTVTVVASNTVLGWLVFTDATAPLTAAGLCTQIDAHTAQCPTVRAGLYLGDGNDVAWLVNTPAPRVCHPYTGTCELDRSFVFGGPGNDRLVGSSFADSEYGEDGNDVLIGNSGADYLSGGAGNDRILAFDGLADGVDCGPGADGLVADPLDTRRVGCEGLLGR